MTVKAKRDIAYDYENYGIDFYKGKIYLVKKLQVVTMRKQKTAVKLH